MAYISFEFCPKCNGNTNHINGKCNVCSILEKRYKRRRIEKLEAKDKRY